MEAHKDIYAADEEEERKSELDYIMQSAWAIEDSPRLSHLAGSLAASQKQITKEIRNVKNIKKLKNRNRVVFASRLERSQ